MTTPKTIFYGVRVYEGTEFPMPSQITEENMKDFVFLPYMVFDNLPDAKRWHGYMCCQHRTKGFVVVELEDTDRFFPDLEPTKIVELT